MTMKKIGRQMSVLMGATLSFCLSLVGNLSSGRFTLPGFIVSFLASLVISLLIGMLVPMKKVTDSLTGKLGLQQGKLSTRCFEALISDLIYTPFITLVMVTLAYRQAVSHGARLSYLPMLGKSMLISLVVGYVLIFILMPVFLKFVLKRNGVGGAPEKR